MSEKLNGFLHNSIMNSFAYFKTFYSSEEERSIENLSKVYCDKQMLYDSVSELFGKCFSHDDIVGKTILLKPNLVLQPTNAQHDICLITHPNLIIAAVKVLLDLGAAKITIADAPIQDCDWSKLFNDNFYKEISELSARYKVTIDIIDLRKVIYNSTTNVFSSSKRNDDDYVIFDLQDKSFLEPITKCYNKFRVTNYDPRKMAKAHKKGMHKYCVAKEVFEADIVITMPKPKTHRMAGMTNSLKILVGINGDKDCLPHHRIGSKSQGGDCYKEFNIYRTFAELAIDLANHYRGLKLRKLFLKVHKRLWRLGKPNDEVMINAGWYGNDTVWRMVMDLNKIAVYGKLDGTLSDAPQRTIFTLCDGIIGGQGEGPLNPSPLALGLLSFSNDSFLMDELMGICFSFNIDKVPLLDMAHKMNQGKQPLILIDGVSSNISDFKKLSTNVDLTSGWKNYDK